MGWRESLSITKLTKEEKLSLPLQHQPQYREVAKHETDFEMQVRFMSSRVEGAAMMLSSSEIAGEMPDLDTLSDNWHNKDQHIYWGTGAVKF